MQLHNPSNIKYSTCKPKSKKSVSQKKKLLLLERMQGCKVQSIVQSFFNASTYDQQMTNTYVPGTTNRTNRSQHDLTTTRTHVAWSNDIRPIRDLKKISGESRHHCTLFKMNNCITVVIAPSQECRWH